MDDRNEKVSDSVERDIQGAVKMGVDAARTSKTLGKAAAHAAAGDVAGAAAEVVKDPETLKKILLILLIPVISFVLITTMFLYALPISIYEGVSTYFADIEEQWESDVYGSDKSTFVAGVEATLKAGVRLSGEGLSRIGDAVSGWFRSIWNGLQSWFTKDDAVDDESDILTEDGYELYVTMNEANEKTTLDEKVSAAQKKLDKRADQIETAIHNAELSINTKLAQMYAGSGVWDGATVCVVKSPTTKSDAIKLLSAYTVMKAGSLDNQKLSDFMKWLGYYKTFAGNGVSFNIGGASGVNGYAKTWCGTFMPQYLEEQMKQDITAKSLELAQAGTLSSNEDYARDIREEYENHMAPAADLLFVVTSPDFSDSSAINLTSYVDDDGITHYSAYFSVSISMRSIDELATDIMGFWSGDLSGIGVSQSEDDTAQEPEDELEEEPTA